MAALLSLRGGYVSLEPKRLRQMCEKLASAWFRAAEALRPPPRASRPLLVFDAVASFARLGGEDILSTAMIVGEANSLVGGVHDRMPVMLMLEDYDRWLGPTTSIDDLKSMLKPYDPALMEAYAVNRAVNSVKNDTEECIEPAA